MMVTFYGTVRSRSSQFIGLVVDGPVSLSCVCVCVCVCVCCELHDIIAVTYCKIILFTMFIGVQQVP